MQKSGAHEKGKEAGKEPKPKKGIIAALAAAIALASPAKADARQRAGTVRAEEEKPPIAREEREGGRQAEEAGEVSVNFEALGSDGELTTMRMRYEAKQGNAEFSFYGPGDTGRERFVLPGPERTVVVTENHIIITIGYEAALRGQDYLTMEGQPVRIRGHTEPANSYFYELPASLKEAGLASAAVAANPGGDSSTLFLLAADGHLRAARAEVMSEPYIHGNLEMGEGAQLLSAGNFAALYEPGSTGILLLSAVFDRGRRIDMREVRLPEAPVGTPSVSVRGADCTISFENMDVMLMGAEPGNPESVTIVVAPR